MWYRANEFRDEQGVGENPREGAGMGCAMGGSRWSRAGALQAKEQEVFAFCGLGVFGVCSGPKLVLIVRKR